MLPPTNESPYWIVVNTEYHEITYLTDPWGILGYNKRTNVLASLIINKEIDATVLKLTRYSRPAHHTVFVDTKMGRMDL